MKRFLLIIISALCVLSLVSCDGANNDNNDTVISEVSIPGSSASVSFGNANSDNNDTTTSEVSAHLKTSSNSSPSKRLTALYQKPITLSTSFGYNRAFPQY